MNDERLFPIFTLLFLPLAVFLLLNIGWCALLNRLTKLCMRPFAFSAQFQKNEKVCNISPLCKRNVDLEVVRTESLCCKHFRGFTRAVEKILQSVNLTKSDFVFDLCGASGKWPWPETFASQDRANELAKVLPPCQCVSATPPGAKGGGGTPFGLWRCGGTVCCCEAERQCRRPRDPAVHACTACCHFFATQSLVGCVKAARPRSHLPCGEHQAGKEQSALKPLRRLQRRFCAGLGKSERSCVACKVCSLLPRASGQHQRLLQGKCQLRATGS